MGPVDDAYRWTLEEYLLRCEQLGDELREVVAEGELDRDLIADAFARWCTNDVDVLDAAYVAVGREEIEKYGFSRGVRGGLLALAKALSARDAEAPIEANVAIVVDRDYDAPEEGKFVLVTDGHSMESYAFSEDVLERFVRVVLGRGALPVGSAGKVADRRRTTTGAHLYGCVFDASVGIGSVRMCLSSLVPPLGVFGSWLDYVELKGDGGLELQAERLLENVLRHHNQEDHEAAVLSELGGRADEVRAEPFRLVRGHDYVALLRKVFSGAWGRRIDSAHTALQGEAPFARKLFSAVDTVTLDESGLFKALHERFA